MFGTFKSASDQLGASDGAVDDNYVDDVFEFNVPKFCDFLKGGQDDLSGDDEWFDTVHPEHEPSTPQSPAKPLLIDIEDDWGEEADRRNTLDTPPSLGRGISESGVRTPTSTTKRSAQFTPGGAAMTPSRKPRLGTPGRVRTPKTGTKSRAMTPRMGLKGTPSRKTDKSSDLYNRRLDFDGSHKDSEATRSTSSVLKSPALRRRLKSPAAKEKKSPCDPKFQIVTCKDCKVTLQLPAQVTYFKCGSCGSEQSSVVAKTPVDTKSVSSVAQTPSPCSVSDNSFNSCVSSGYFDRSPVTDSARSSGEHHERGTRRSGSATRGGSASLLKGGAVRNKSGPTLAKKSTATRSRLSKTSKLTKRKPGTVTSRVSTRNGKRNVTSPRSGRTGLRKKVKSDSSEPALEVELDDEMAALLSSHNAKQKKDPEKGKGTRASRKDAAPRTALRQLKKPSPSATTKASSIPTAASTAAKKTTTSTSRGRIRSPVNTTTNPKARTAATSRERMAGSSSSTTSATQKRTLKKRKASAMNGNSNEGAENNPRSNAGSNGSGSPLKMTKIDKSELAQDEEIAALLAQHNSKFKKKSAYEPRVHSQRHIKMWETRNGRRWHSLSVSEREQANAEIRTYKKV